MKKTTRIASILTGITVSVLGIIYVTGTMTDETVETKETEEIEAAAEEDQIIETEKSAEEQDHEFEEEAKPIVGDEHAEHEWELADAIDESHKLLNQFTGHGGIEDFQSDEAFDNVEGSLLHKADLIEDLIGLASSDIKGDLENFIKITRLAVEENNQDALVYSHRIIHDLDVAYNGYDEEQYGATIYAGVQSGERYNRVQTLVEKAERVGE
ncbi:hypothetical protein [Thalassobacillus sp. C254]|uniref:hypothetical protein n=1 Tax=Thalassobacillus sp. C254 TaxID=1225341 RepID=UPI0006D091E5|nr:hypothetical protein [Thalassobacillus sp. C254]